ncbi:VOC family protein [Tabrizicola thermarum]|uniref:VOC family protein n=1 Tax=Tabrizicola thermarum TaxID=2670345 RepID=UPI000FFBDC16|nr:VOC family protein [Tabrizicola thermarum]
MTHPAPAFTKTMQIGIVVPDVEAAARNYEEQFGIGGWRIMEIGSENTHDVRLHGQRMEWKSKIAITMVGSVMWELIQPVAEDDLFGQFLAQRGGVGGVHHIAVATPDYRKVVRQQAEKGSTPILSGTFSGVDVQYLDTERDLGVILEVFSHMPDGIEQPGG